MLSFFFLFFLLNEDHSSRFNCVSQVETKSGRGGRGNPVQGASQAVPMGPGPRPVEGARSRGPQDPLPPVQTLLPNPDAARTGAEGLCKPQHH